MPAVNESPPHPVPAEEQAQGLWGTEAARRALRFAARAVGNGLAVDQGAEGKASGEGDPCQRMPQGHCAAHGQLVHALPVKY